jgi:hypothetical protein
MGSGELAFQRNLDESLQSVKALEVANDRVNPNHPFLETHGTRSESLEIWYSEEN